MKLISTFLFSVILLQACKKDITSDTRAVSSFTVVNAAIGISSAKAYASENSMVWKTLPAANSVNFVQTAQMGAFAANNNVRAVSSADTNLVLFQSAKAETFAEGGFNTLFLCGQAGTYEGIFISSDDIVNHTDSVMGIRFINLSPNSTPLSINLSTTPAVNEATGLAYKQKTSFKTYPAISTTTSMIFQVRNAGGTLLASYTLPVTPVSAYATAGIPFARFKNLTLVVKGLQGTTSGTNALGIFPVPHY